MNRQDVKGRCEMYRNANGLTYTEWLRAAGFEFSRTMNGWPLVGKDRLPALRVARAAWEAGEDPTDYRAEGVFKGARKTSVGAES